MMKLFPKVPADATVVAVALLWTACMVVPASATVSNDRLYEFGGSGSTDGSLGANIGEGYPLGFVFGGKVSTADETGIPPAGGNDIGSLIDLDIFPNTASQSHTGATYTSTASRPLGVGGEFGARFDGVDDVLSGLALNRPDEFAGRLPAPATYPIDYSNVTTRGLQMWTRPDQAGLNAGVRQTIVMDTVAAGGVAITADGNWTQINDGHANDADIGATVAVAGNTWYHVMHHIYESSDANATIATGGGADHISILYVDGIAVSANADTVDTGDFNAGDRVGVLTVGAAELADQDADDQTVDLGEFYDGTVDDLALYVNQDGFGPFDLFADNEWIANEVSQIPGGQLLPGDVDKDGSVELVDDVNAFVAGWLSEKRLVGAHNELTVGDWETWGWGDMNLDGRVNLADWAIMNAASPALGAAIGNAISAIPEPSSALLITLAAMCAGCTRRFPS